MSTQAQFLQRGTRVIIVFGRHAGESGTVAANALKKFNSAEYTAAFRVQLDDGNLVTVRTDQVAQH